MSSVATPDEFQVHDFCGNPIRHFRDPEGRRWFHLMEVCDALGIKNSRDWVKKANVEKVYVSNSAGRPYPTNFVLANDLYSRIIPTSRVPGAEKFKKWVGRVMNQVVETGHYDVRDDPEFKRLDYENEMVALNERKLKLDERKLVLFQMKAKSKRDDYEFLKRAAQEMNDDRLRMMAVDCAANYMGTALMIQDTNPYTTISEMNNDEKWLRASEWNKYKSAIGKHVASAEEFKNIKRKKTTKYVNNHACKVNLYPRLEKQLIGKLVLEKYNLIKSTQEKQDTSQPTLFGFFNKYL